MRVPTTLPTASWSKADSSAPDRSDVLKEEATELPRWITSTPEFARPCDPKSPECDGSPRIREACVTMGAMAVSDSAPAPHSELVRRPYQVLEFGQVHVQVQIAPVTAEGLKLYLDEQVGLIHDAIADGVKVNESKVVVIVHPSVGLMPPAEARQVQADWLKDNAHALRVATHCTSLVLPNPLLRGFAASVLHFVSTPIPMVTHGSLRKALSWAIEEVLKLGGKVDPALLDDPEAVIERERNRAIAAARQRT
jgi:hypothetical protein